MITNTKNIAHYVKLPLSSCCQHNPRNREHEMDFQCGIMNICYKGYMISTTTHWLLYSCSIVMIDQTKAQHIIEAFYY